MSTIILTLSSEIHPSLKKRALWRGTTLSVLALGLLFGLTFYPEILYRWGLEAFFFSIFLIAMGFLPYKKILRHEIAPDQLLVFEDAIAYKRAGKIFFILPIRSLHSFHYFEKNSTYGIGVLLQRPFEEKILIKDQKKKMNHFHKKSQKKYQFDFFFPYFTERSYQKLKTLITKNNVKFIHQGKLFSTETFLENIMHTEDSNNL